MSNGKVKILRFAEIDLLRGLAVVGMIIFHFFYVLDFYDVFAQTMYEGGWAVLRRFVQFSFLGLIGVCLAISCQKSENRTQFRIKQVKRGLFVLLLGVLISVVTWLFMPEEFVVFGILHIIGICIIVYGFIAHRPYLSGLFGLFLILLSAILQNSGGDSFISYILGLNYGFAPHAVDYFPILPWASVTGIGLSLGYFLYGGSDPKFNIKSGRLSRILGPFSKRALLIYLVHVPIIIAVLVLFGIIPLEVIFKSV